jgi:hypothetical protein
MRIPAIRRLASVAVVAVSLLLTPVHTAEAGNQNCWPGEVWMTAEGYPFCALASPQGACYYCEIHPIVK